MEQKLYLRGKDFELCDFEIWSFVALSRMINFIGPQRED